MRRCSSRVHRPEPRTGPTPVARKGGLGRARGIRSAPSPGGYRAGHAPLIASAMSGHARCVSTQPEQERSMLAPHPIPANVVGAGARSFHGAESGRVAPNFVDRRLNILGSRALPPPDAGHAHADRLLADSPRTCVSQKYGCIWSRGRDGPFGPPPAQIRT